MYFFARAALVFLSALFLLVAAFGGFRLFLEFGVSPLRYVVQDAALLLAGAAGLFACARKSKALRTAREEADARATFGGPRFEAPARVTLQIGLMVFFALLAVGAATLFVLRPGIEIALVALGFAFVTVLFALIVRSMRGDGTALRIDARGIRHPWYGEIPWEDVHGFSIREVQIQYSRIYTLQLGVASPQRYLARRPAMARLLSYRGDRGGETRYGTLEIPLNTIAAKPSAVLAALRSLQQRAGTAMVEHWGPGVDDAIVDLARGLHTLEAEQARLTPEQIAARFEALQPDFPAMRARTNARIEEARRSLWRINLFAVVVLLIAIAMIASKFLGR